MIIDFNCKETEKLWHGYSSRKLPANIQARALEKLRQLNAAQSLVDLQVPPSNHLEKLSGNRKGQMSIRINNQWRLCFEWFEGQAIHVEIIDYH